MSEAVHEPDTDASASEAEQARALAQALERAGSREWQAVALGHATLDEVAASRAAAGDDPETIARARRLFAPYDELEDRKLVDALLVSARQHDREANDERRRRQLLGASLLAIAAALALTFVAFSDQLRGTGEPLEPIAALPSYAIETDEGLATKRSTPQAPSPAAPLRYASANTFEWTLRPAIDLVGPAPLVAARARDAEGQVHPLALRFESAPSGALHTQGTIAELGLAPGEWTIELTLLRPSGRHLARQALELALTLEP